MLAGKKTYVTAILYALLGWGSYLIGGEAIEGVQVETMEEALKMTFEAAMVVFLRKGITDATKTNSTNGG